MHGFSARGEVGIDDEEIVFHFDDGVVAVAVGFEVAFTHPNAGGDGCGGLGLGEQKEWKDCEEHRGRLYQRSGYGGMGEGLRHRV